MLSYWNYALSNETISFVYYFVYYYFFNQEPVIYRLLIEFTTKRPNLLRMFKHRTATLESSLTGLQDLSEYLIYATLCLF